MSTAGLSIDQRRARSRRRPALWVLAGAILVVATDAAPLDGVELSMDQRVAMFHEALRAFDRGTQMRHSDPPAAERAFRESSDKLQLLVDSGIRNGKLYYNLGNAYLSAGALGKAILSYRRAETLIAGDGQLEANLRFARSLRRNQFAVDSGRAVAETLFAWHFQIPARMRYGLAAGAYLGFWLILLARVFRPAVRWNVLLIPLAVMWVSLAVSLTVETIHNNTLRDGVLLADEVVVRKGNGEGFEAQFDQPLNEGVEFTVLEQRRDWLHIELPDGKSGWIRSNHAERVIPQPETQRG